MSRLWPPRMPRWTTRRIMAAVAVLAVILGLGLPAIEVYRADDLHAHSWIGPARQPFQGIHWYGPETRLKIETLDGHLTPFWPRYLRYLAGREWRGQPLCTMDPNRISEVCEYSRPDLIIYRGGNKLVTRHLPDLVSGLKRRTALILAEEAKQAPKSHQE